MSEFLDFCQNFKYKDGCNCFRFSIMDIFYNINLVLNDLRLSFMIQPIDYINRLDYEKIIDKIVRTFDNLSFSDHNQGKLVYLTKNKHLFENCECVNDEKLGFLLSYPFYHSKPDNSYKKYFFDFIVEDKYGEHQLFANWYYGNLIEGLEKFSNDTKNMKEFLDLTFDVNSKIKLVRV